jgi:UDP-N-acetyl-D-glucosamine dehydrogenase
MREHYFDLKSITLSAESLKQFDCVVIATNHDAFDYALIKKHAKLIVDTRGVFSEPAHNIVRA